MPIKDAFNTMMKNIQTRASSAPEMTSLQGSLLEDATWVGQNSSRYFRLMVAFGDRCASSINGTFGAQIAH
jgi:hypothetical protein